MLAPGRSGGIHAPSAQEQNTKTSNWSLHGVGYRLRHEDHVLEMPQSRERIRGRDAIRAMQEVFPEPLLLPCAG